METKNHDGDITPGMNSWYGDITPDFPTSVDKKIRWGSRGTRYDECCDRCGRTAEVDNSTGLCQRCGT